MLRPNHWQNFGFKNPLSFTKNAYCSLLFAGQTYPTFGHLHLLSGAHSHSSFTHDATHSLHILTPSSYDLRYSRNYILHMCTTDIYTGAAKANALPHHVWHKADIPTIRDAANRACDERSHDSLLHLAHSLQVISFLTTTRIVSDLDVRWMNAASHLTVATISQPPVMLVTGHGRCTQLSGGPPPLTTPVDSVHISCCHPRTTTTCCCTWHTLFATSIPKPTSERRWRL